MSSATPPQVLDVAQLRRIQGTHRGFLYQHIYAAYCYLASPQSGVIRIRVERDEDIELDLDGCTVYAQIKNYDAPLSPSDLKGVLERFEDIRQAHQDGQRVGQARFAIVASGGLGPTLTQHDWPADVVIVTPDCKGEDLAGTGLLVPPANGDDLFRETQTLAEAHRLSAVRPESLVCKLVGAVARAAAGEGPNTCFEQGDLGRFCELVAAQLQPLPSVEQYDPQVGEPELPDEHRTGLVVVGHAGNGKSAWAANVSALSSSIVTYLPCSPSTEQNVSARVVQACVATLASRGEIRAHELVLPGRTGVDALSLLNRELEQRGIALTVILDDCHRASADALVETMRAGPAIRWCLVGRPSSSLAEAAALSGLEQHVLEGWDSDTVARRLAEAGASAAPDAVEALRQLTGGAPLFVLRAVAEIGEFDGDTSAYCSRIEDGGSTRETAQEQILERTVAGLQPDEIRVAAALAAVEVGFALEELEEFLEGPLDMMAPHIRRTIRRLVERQIAIETVRDHVAIHDAFRPLVRGRALDKRRTNAVLVAASDLLRKRITDERDLEAISPLIRTLAVLGEMSQLADIANAMSEWIREVGARSEVKSYVELAVADGSLHANDRFWALDTLAFFDIETGDADTAAERLSVMEGLASELGPECRGPILHKRMLIAAVRGDVETVRSVAQSASAEPRYERILRYHAALAEADVGNVKRAVDALFSIANEYLNALGLSQEQVLGANPPALFALMGPDADVGEVRRLADCYDAITKLARRLPQPQPIARLTAIWAMKFYGMVGAPRSALLAGQDAVDVILGDLGDPEEARKWMERTLLPAAAQAKLPDLTVPLRAQYAMVLAHCGDLSAAAAIFQKLEPYVDSLPAEGQAEIAKQRRLFRELELRGPPTPDQLEERRKRIAAQHLVANELRRHLPGTSLPTGSTPVRARKVGRNQPCPCGSGKKSKKCCGA